MLVPELREKIVLDGTEIGSYGFHPADRIDALLIPRLARRVHAAIQARSTPRTDYLEHGSARA